MFWMLNIDYSIYNHTNSSRRATEIYASKAFLQNDIILCYSQLYPSNISLLPLDCTLVSVVSLVYNTQSNPILNRASLVITSLRIDLIWSATMVRWLPWRCLGWVFSVLWL